MDSPLFAWAPHSLWGEPRCDSCPFLVEASLRPNARKPADAGSDGANWCALRELAIARPRDTSCANHAGRSEQRDRLPIGPVVDLRSDEALLLAPSPDRESIRRELLDLLEEVRVRSEAELTLRQRMALWQLEAFGERRAMVEVDRIEGGIAAASAGRSVGMPALNVDHLIVKAVVRSVLGEDGKVEGQGANFVESFTIPGRLLILSAIVVAALAFTGIVEWALPKLPTGRYPLLLAAIPAALAAALYLKLGIFVLRSFGIDFRRR